MFVRNTMIEEITTVSPDDTLDHAYEMINSKHYDALPVLGARRTLLGLITLYDIHTACMNHGRVAGLAKKVKDVMNTQLVTVGPDDLIERAAKIMYQRDRTCLPVVEDGELKGIINGSDIYKSFSEMLGVDSGTIRLTLVVPERKGQLARIADIIRSAGVTITHVATFHSTILNQYKIVVRVESDASRPIVELLEQHGYKVSHVSID